MRAYIKKNQQGFSLLEVLVAIIVISFGLLGMAGLQGNALKMNRSALQSSLATELGHDMLERLRLARPSGGEYEIELDDPIPTGTDVRDENIATWREGLIGALGPGALGGIERITRFGADNFHRVTIQWSDATQTEAGNGTMQVERITRTVVIEGRL